MTTYATLKNRVADELLRDDLLSGGQVANAVLDAIKEYERERFWFNESRALTFSTVASQREYTTADATWIPDVITIDAMFVTVSGQVRPLCKADPARMESLNDSSSPEGQPRDWAYLGGSIILYPTPDAVYTVRAVAHYRLTALSADGDSNAWTTDAASLIRRRAKQLLHQEVLFDYESAGAQNPLIEQALYDLRAETSRRKTLGRIQPTSF